uniref:Uncharacterized protein n=1 Tax=Arundo donax TaxID=35708 RepID=A0A0A9AKF4_ARUDO
MNMLHIFLLVHLQLGWVFHSVRCPSQIGLCFEELVIFKEFYSMP